MILISVVQVHAHDSGGTLVAGLLLAAGFIAAVVDYIRKGTN